MTEIQLSYFKSWKMMLWKCCTQTCQQTWKTQQWPQDWKKSVFIPVPKKSKAKECSNYHTIALISHASKVKFKILQPGLNRTLTENFQMFKRDLEKGEEPEIKLPTSVGSSKKWEFQKIIYFCFIDYTKAFDCVDHNKLKNILKETGIPDHLTCLLRNLNAGQEATVRTGHGTIDCFQIGKEVCQGCILSSCLFNLYVEYLYELSSLMKHKLESRFLGEISITSDMQMTPPLWQKAEQKSLLMKVKEESEKSWLQTQHSENEHHGIWSHDFMANRWGNNGNSESLYFLVLQNHCRWWLQPWN